MTTSRGSVTLVVWSSVVVAAVLGGLFLIGSPTDERARRIDSRRLTDLRSIAAATDLYWTRHDRLPTSVDELAEEPGVNVVAVDPVNGNPYEYTPVDSVEYELCAVFERESRVTRSALSDNVWAHGPGRQCFVLEAKEVTDRSVARFQPR